MCIMLPHSMLTHYGLYYCRYWLVTAQFECCYLSSQHQPWSSTLPVAIFTSIMITAHCSIDIQDNELEMTNIIILSRMVKIKMSQTLKLSNKLMALKFVTSDINASAQITKHLIYYNVEQAASDISTHFKYVPFIILLNRQLVTSKQISKMNKQLVTST